jgi:hypothetical protein
MGERRREVPRIDALSRLVGRTVASHPKSLHKHLSWSQGEAANYTSCPACCRSESDPSTKGTACTLFGCCPDGLYVSAPAGLAALLRR